MDLNYCYQLVNVICLGLALSDPHKAASTIYIIKELVQPKKSLNREFLIWKERGRG